ncbi:MAG: hypothetical protein ACLTER_12845 [Ruminococcus sp.]
MESPIPRVIRHVVVKEPVKKLVQKRSFAGRTGKLRNRKVEEADGSEPHSEKLLERTVTEPGTGRQKEETGVATAETGGTEAGTERQTES